MCSIIRIYQILVLLIIFLHFVIFFFYSLFAVCVLFYLACYGLKLTKYFLFLLLLLLFCTILSSFVCACVFIPYSILINVLCQQIFETIFILDARISWNQHTKRMIVLVWANEYPIILYTFIRTYINNRFFLRSYNLNCVTIWYDSLMHWL